MDEEELRAHQDLSKPDSQRLSDFEQRLVVHERSD
jgi:hypothetical protein